MSTRRVVTPTTYRAAATRDLVDVYLAGTPFIQFFATPVPFSIPERVRFEHTHILAGSGHGKTQTLQRLILSDLTRPDPPAWLSSIARARCYRRSPSLVSSTPTRVP